MTTGISVSLAELLKLRFAARGIDLVHRKAVVNARAGGYQSCFRGRGIDFEEVRRYQAGDDIRTIDWRVTARTGKPHTKLFREERERTVYFLVDFNPSMYFGSRVAFKSVLAAQACAILAWAAVANNDQVGGLVFSNQQHQEVLANPGMTGILPLLKTLAQQSTPQVTGHNDRQALVKALQRLRHSVATGSLIFIISDFYNWDETAASLIGQLARHNDIGALYIYDKLEKQLPTLANTYSFAAANQYLMLNSADRQFCALYAQQFEQRFATLQQFMRRLTLPLITLATDQSPAAVLQKYWPKNLRGIR